MQGNPDEVPAAARSRVERLERALSILGEGDSAEIRGLQAALKEARRAAQDRPLAAQVEECQAFFQRSRRRLEHLQEGTGQRTAAVGHRSGAHGKISRGDGQDDRARPNSGPHAHTAREDPRAGRRAGSIEGTLGRDGDQAARRFGKNLHGLCQCRLQIWLVAMCRCKSGVLCTISVLASTRVRSCKL